MKQNIIISAGGTGGHIFPALAVAKELEKYYNVYWVGGKLGLENTIVPKHSIKLFTVSVLGVRNKGFLRKLFLPFMMLHCIIQCVKIIMQLKPVAIVGFGGYVAFPICLSGKLLAKKIIIHEQNSVIGLTNKTIAKFADLIITAFPNVLNNNKVLMLGNPVRHEIILKSPLEKYLMANKFRVLIIGGSLGAQVFNDYIPDALALVKDRLLQVTHQVGRGDKTLVEAKYNNLAISNVDVVNFIDDMASVYQSHDVIICRAGALTVAEVSCAGIVPIFIPYPYAVDDHQTKNANYLVDNDAGYLLAQNDFTPQSLADIIKQLTQDSLLIKSQNLIRLALIDSTQDIVNSINNLVRDYA